MPVRDGIEKVTVMLVNRRFRRFGSETQPTTGFAETGNLKPETQFRVRAETVVPPGFSKHDV